jgi:hypothetical protein
VKGKWGGKDEEEGDKVEGSKRKANRKGGI